MLEQKIEKMRHKLDQMVLTEPFDSHRLIAHSQALDQLIVDIMKCKANRPHEIIGQVSQQRMDRDNSNKGSLSDIRQQGDTLDRQLGDILDRQPGSNFGQQQDDISDRQLGSNFRRQLGDISAQQLDGNFRRQQGDIMDRQHEDKKARQRKDDTLPSNNHENLTQMQQKKLLGHKHSQCLVYELIISPIKIGL